MMHKAIVKRCLLLVAFMLVFTCALIPLYDVFCDVTGLNGKVNLNGFSGKSKIKQVNSNRVIAVSFDVSKNPELNLKFTPLVRKVNLRPGDIFNIKYKVKNPYAKQLVVQAIPSITPGKAAKHLKKIDCFCFNQLVLPAKSEVLMNLEFYLAHSIDAKIQDLTLSYTLYDITDTPYALS